jgi:hypothetical protein
MWSDESPYVLRNACRRRCWRKPGERYINACLKKTVKHDQKVMVWGCFAAHGGGLIKWIKGIMCKEDYEEVLNSYMVPSGHILFGAKTLYSNRTMILSIQLKVSRPG